MPSAERSDFMQFVDYVIVAVVLTIAGIATWYVIRSKKSGKKCIGCPSGGNCSGGCGNCSGQCGDK